MKTITSKNKLKKIIQSQKSLGFVPTMGALHNGHISLINKSMLQCSKTIVSIFINKAQFNRNNDYHSYPRVMKKDISILKKLKIDYLYIPTEKQIYPDGVNRNIKISSFQNALCGKNRPGHFKAVVDVIDRFIKLIKPKKIYLGEKDMQQLKIIEHFIKSNKIKTKVVGCRTVREKNGIAFSSRNFLLSSNDKIIASKIYQLIRKKKKQAIKNRIFLRKIKRKIIKFGIKKIDYIKILDVNNLLDLNSKKKKYRIFVAYYIKSTRLIDNI